MRRLLISGSVSLALVLGLGVSPSWATSEGPVYPFPHGMIQPSLDSNNKIVTLNGAGQLAGKMLFNQVGQSVLPQNLVDSVPISTPPFFITTAGGIAERLADGSVATITTAPTATLLQTDDPGFLSSGFPDGYLLRATFSNTLQYFDPGTMTWGAPVSGDQIRVSDLFLNDNDFTGNSTGNVFDLILNAGSVGAQGTINIGVVGFDNAGNNTGEPIHSHLRYALSRSGGGIPAVGAYMIELQLSAEQVVGSGGPVLGDSDPIFFVFNNQLTSTLFNQAVDMALVIPEPATATIVTAVALGLVALRRRSKQATA